MGLKSAIVGRVKNVVKRFSGEYSAVAPDKLEPYATNLGEDPTRKVVRAKLNRPVGGPKSDDDDGAES